MAAGNGTIAAEILHAATQLLQNDFIRAAVPGNAVEWGAWAALSEVQSQELSSAFQSDEAIAAMQCMHDCYKYAEEHETLQTATSPPPSPERIRQLVARLNSCLMQAEGLQLSLKDCSADVALLARPPVGKTYASTPILKEMAISPALLAHTIAICTLRALASHHALSFSGSRSFAWDERQLLPPTVAALMLNIAMHDGSAHAALVANAVLRSQLPMHPSRSQQHAFVAAVRMALLQRGAAEEDPVACFLLAQMYQQEVLGVSRHSEVPALLEQAAAGGVAAAAAYKAYVHLMHAHGQQGGPRAQAEAAAALRALLSLSQAGSAEASLHYLMAVAYGVGSFLPPNKERATAVWLAAKAALPQDRFVTLGCRAVLDGVVEAPEGFQPVIVLEAAASKGHDGALAVLASSKGKEALRGVAPLMQQAHALEMSPLECAAVWCHQRETLVQAWAADCTDAQLAAAGLATAALHRTVAIRQLAQRVNHGHGCTQNSKRAEVLFRVAAKRGDMASIVALGELAAQRHLVTGEARYAVSAQTLLSKTASAGSESALRLLGLLQFYGRCDLPRSLNSAFSFAEALRSSHASGKVRAGSNESTLLAWTHAVYGASLLEGAGGQTIDAAGARAEFEKGCAAQELYCMYHLAYMLERGQGGEQDVHRASILYSKTRQIANQHLASGQRINDPPLQDILTGCDAGLRRCREAADAAWWRTAALVAAAGTGAAVAGWLLLGRGNVEKEKSGSSKH